MKKLFVIAIASVGLMLAQADATVTINVGAGDLLVNGASSALIPTSTMVLLVVDTAADGIQENSLALGQSLTVGSLIGNDYVAAVFDASGGGAGNPNSAVVLSLGGQILASRTFGIMWFPGLTTADTQTTTASNGHYGSYTGGLTPNIGDPWTIPADGNTITIVLATASQSGPDPDSAGFASGVVAIPEPSTMLLVGVGLLGAVVVRRRKA